MTDSSIKIKLQRHKLCILVVATIVWVLNSCVAGITTYFEPSGERITIKARQCGQSGAPDTAVFSIDEVIIYSRVTVDAPFVINIEVRVPEGKSVTLGGIQYSLNRKLYAIPLTTKVKQISPEIFLGADTLNDPLLGYTEKKSGLLPNIHAFYRLNHQIDAEELKSLTLIFEGMTVNQKLYPSKRIDFKIKKSPVVYSLNC